MRNIMYTHSVLYKVYDNITYTHSMLYFVYAILLQFTFVNFHCIQIDSNTNIIFFSITPSICATCRGAQSQQKKMQIFARILFAHCIDCYTPKVFVVTWQRARWNCAAAVIVVVIVTTCNSYCCSKQIETNRCIPYNAMTQDDKLYCLVYS